MPGSVGILPPAGPRRSLRTSHRWILGRFYLRHAFEFLLALGYRVGKVTPRGVEFYPGWDADLETFVEGNYLACDPEVAWELPAVTWWKSG